MTFEEWARSVPEAEWDPFPSKMTAGDMEMAWDAAQAAEREKIVAEIMDCARMLGDPFTSSDPRIAALVLTAKQIRARSKTTNS